MSKASATKLDPEAQEAAAAPPPGSRRRRFAGAAAVAALVLLSLGELLLPLPEVGADDARVEIGFDGKDVLVDVDARPLAGRAWLHEVRVTRATCDVRAQAAGGALERVATVDAEFAGAGWPVRARTITREKLVARVRDVDFDVARRLASSKLLYGSVKCDVVAETQLYGGLFPTTVHSNVGTAWVPTLASKQKLFKKGSPPKRVWHDLRALAALVKDSLELSIDEDGALAARWTESWAAVRLPAGMEAVTLRLPRVAYDLTGRAGGAGTLAFEGAELRFASDVPTLLDLPFRATGAFSLVGGEALDAMSTRVVALNATAVDADAFFGALLGPQHAVALRWSPEFTRDESAACYAARYEDLRDAFCTEDRCDTRALRRHYKHYGAAEKRLWGCRTPARRLAGAPEGAPPRRLDETGCVPDHCMTMTWDGDYTFTGCVGFDVDGKWLCAELERTRVSTGVVYEVAASAEGECCDGDVATSVFRLSATDEGGEVKLDGALVGELAWSGEESDLSASLTASDQGVDKFSVAVAADGEASDDDAYEGGLTGAVQLTVATDDDQLLTAVTDDDQFEATLGGDVTWKKTKESTMQGCTCEGEEWTYSPWGNDYQGSTGNYRPTTEDQQDELDVCEIDEVWGCLYGQENYIWDYGYYYGFPRWCATDSSSCGFCDGTIADGKCWDWVQPVDGEYEDYGADAVEASMTMKLSAPESIGEPLEEVVGVALGVDACVQLDDGARNKGCRAAHADDVTITVTADLDADVDLITAAVTFDVREDDDAGDGSLSVKVGDDDVFSLEASVDAPDAVEGVGRTCFFTAFDANMRGFFGSEDMYSDMSMGLAFDDFAWFDAELADSEASMAMTGAGLGEGFTVSTWDADATQGTVDRAACDAVVDIDLSLFMASPEKRKFKADNVIAGAATFSGITAADADTAAARAVFRDAIARVTGVDKDQVRILSVSAAAAARRRLTESVTVEFEVHPRKREAASVSANLLAAEADPTIVEAALQAAAADSDDETMVALFADVKTESFTTDVERSAPKKKKKRGEDLALYAILLIAAACLCCFCACGLAAYVYVRRAKDSADPAPIVEVKSIGTADESALPKAVASAAPPLMPPPPPTGRNFCSACGAPLRGAFCGNCGARA